MFMWNKNATEKLSAKSKMHLFLSKGVILINLAHALEITNAYLSLFLFLSISILISVFPCFTIKKTITVFQAGGKLTGHVNVEFSFNSWSISSKEKSEIFGIATFVLCAASSIVNTADVQLAGLIKNGIEKMYYP